MASRLSILVLVAFVACASATTPAAPAPTIFSAPSAHETGDQLYQFVATFTGDNTTWADKKVAIEADLEVAFLALGVDISYNTPGSKKFTTASTILIPVIISVVGAKKTSSEAKTILESKTWQGYAVSGVVAYNYSAAVVPQLMTMLTLAIVAIASYMAI